MDPFTTCPVIPVASGDEVLEYLDVCQLLARVLAGRLAVAVDAGLTKHRIERLVPFGREEHRWAKLFDVKRQVNKEVKLWLRDKDTRSTKGGEVEEVLDRPSEPRLK